MNFTIFLVTKQKNKYSFYVILSNFFRVRQIVAIRTQTATFHLVTFNADPLIEKIKVATFHTSIEVSHSQQTVVQK